jgi:hypothetical protein
MLGVSLHGFAHGAACSWNGRGVDDGVFTDLFCFHVFHQRDNQLAKSLRALGRADLAIGGPFIYKSPLYFVLVEPLIRPKDLKESWIDKLPEAGLEKVISQLSGPNMWPKLSSQADTFDRLAIEEFALAAEMDVLAARRALIAKKLRKGETVPSKDLRGLAEGTEQMSRRFQKLWLARNKPSRLLVNLRAFEKLAREAAKIASGQRAQRHRR